MKCLESSMSVLARLAEVILVRRLGEGRHGEARSHRDGATSSYALRGEPERGAVKIARRLATAALSVLVVAVALWSGGAQAQSCNLATNGSFESPNIQTEAQRPGENTAFANGYAVW